MKSKYQQYYVEGEDEKKFISVLKTESKKFISPKIVSDNVILNVTVVIINKIQGPLLPKPERVAPPNQRCANG